MSASLKQLHWLVYFVNEASTCYTHHIVINTGLFPTVAAVFT